MLVSLIYLFFIYSFGVSEVLKQVWDLSDQDSDSMLSLREFCIALYLMERYREGRPLPAALPSTVMYDEILLRATGMPSAAYGTPAWQPGISCQLSDIPDSVCPHCAKCYSGLGLPQQGLPGSHPVMETTGMRPSMQNSIPPQAFVAGHVVQQNLGKPGFNNQIAKNLGKDVQSTINSDQNGANVDSKVNFICSDSNCVINNGEI